jgi:hypothetical protein
VQDEFPEFENTVTVNTLISAGDSVKIYLAYTDELNENPLETIENAEITMSNQNWDNISFTHQGNGLYISDYIAQVNDTFNLTVVVPNEDIVTSTCVVPEPIEIIDASVDLYGWVDDEGIASPLVHLKIKNDPNKAFYGVVYAQIYSEEQSYLENPYYTDDPDCSEAPFYLDSILYIYTSCQDYKAIGTIDNITENGEFIEKELGIVRTSFQYPVPKYAFQIKLRTVDYNYYTYLNSIGAYDVGRNPDFTNSFIVPSNLYSNIENGYGIMCSYSEFETDTIY